MSLVNKNLKLLQLYDMFKKVEIQKKLLEMKNVSEI